MSVAKLEIAPWTTAIANNIILGHYGSKSIAIFDGRATARESASCWSRCEVMTPINAPIHYLGANARLTIHDDWSIPQGQVITFYAANPEVDKTTAGTLIVTGDLSTEPAGTTINVIGVSLHLPVRLVTAHTITGTWRAGTIPPGTQLTITPTGINLTRRLRK